MRVIVFILILIIAIIMIGYGFYHYFKKGSAPESVLLPSELMKEIGENRSLYSIVIASPTIENGGDIPKKYTCDGKDVSPPLKITGLPRETRYLVIIMYDPDAPGSFFYHWLLYDVVLKNDTQSLFLPEGIPKKTITDYGLQGINDFNNIGYNGPCPPKGSKHRYIFLVISLNKTLDIPPGASKIDVINSVKNNIIGYGYLLGMYGR